MTAATHEFKVTASFADEAGARDAVQELRAAGFDAARISISLATSVAEREAPFLWRVVLVIVAWSIVGGAVGVGIGLLLASLGIGPGDSVGVVLQVVSWTIFGHLIAGMWAGYALLADRSKPEFAPPTGQARSTTVTVTCRDRREIDTARATLARHGANELSERVATTTAMHQL